MSQTMKKMVCRVPTSTSPLALAFALSLVGAACSSSSSGGGTGGSAAGTGGSVGTGGTGVAGMVGTGGSGVGGSGTGGSVPDAAIDTPAPDAAVDAIVVHDGSTDGGAYVHTGWTAEYTCTGGVCPARSAADTGDVNGNAFDGTTATRWSTGQFQSTLDMNPTKFPLYFTVDMGEVLNVSRITMHPGCKDSLDSGGTVEFFFSVDGTSLANAVFGAAAGPIHTVPTAVLCANINSAPTAANGLDTINFTRAPARFIRIKATRRVNPDKYWAIGELNVFP